MKKEEDLETYNGVADVQIFHHFVQEMMAYIDGYQLCPQRHTMTVFWFLSGKAYEFYLNTVSAQPHNWTLQHLLIEWFNYRLFLMVGHLTNEAKVEKLWYGLCGSLQAELWRAHLDPLTSSWDNWGNLIQGAGLSTAAVQA
ncbi:hypothetical protein C8Q77DRAFT_1220067 [Trametes polyzona]|nr:hypothetical protein C8Q77DRAFT_1220067 [Trametes polyzona]